MIRLFVFLAILGLGYWYWSARHEAPSQDAGLDRPSENATIMKECLQYLDRESATQGLVGYADGGSVGEAERLCAAKNNLVKGDDGQWHKK